MPSRSPAIAALTFLLLVMFAASVSAFLASTQRGGVHLLRPHHRQASLARAAATRMWLAPECGSHHGRGLAKLARGGSGAARGGAKGKARLGSKLGSTAGDGEDSSSGPEVLRDFGAGGGGTGDNGGDGVLVGLNGEGGPADKVIPIELNSELSTSFMQYAMSTILGRALPDARDGLKPVHRRILFAMHVLNLQPESSYRKCARVVGEVLGKYHPHGDSSVYDALVRMAQDFVMSAPLVAGHGNFGSVDDDPAAAMRYTECKLSLLARDALLADINLDTVDFVPNFDGNEIEPLVLPARIPMLLLNGATGIAVGMATNVPPHNLGEIIDGTLALIADPALPDEKLLKFIPAPDFPTGGEIMGLEGATKLYTNGTGSIIMRAKTHMETISVGGGRQARNAIIVTELPYQVNKAALLEKIADMVNDKKMEGISDLRDESDRDGIRVVIELKRDAVPSVVENNLFKKTPLQSSFPGNFLALGNDGRQPQRLTLRDSLQSFINFRFKTIRRRTQHELRKVEARDHLVEGLIRALDRIDDVVELVRRAKDTAAAKATLMGPEYEMSEAQAQAILALTLGRLTALEDAKLRAERAQLRNRIDEFQALMREDEKVYEVMKSELKEIRAKHAVPRRSLIRAHAGMLTELDLLANDRSVMMVTEAGYIKRMPLDEFEQQRRGTRGKAGARMGQDDLVNHFFACNDHDHVVFISEKGVAFGIRAFQVPIASRASKGVPLPQVLPLSSDDRVSSVLPLGDTFQTDEFLVLLTKQGFIKKTPIEAFKKLTSRGLIAICLGEGDTLGWARRCTDQDDILISTRKGYTMRFASADLKPTGRTSRGCRAIKLRKTDEMVDITVLRPEAAAGAEVTVGGDDAGIGSNGQYLLAVTTAGYGKRVSADSFKAQKRGGMGVIAIKFKAGTGDSLACMRACSDDYEVVLSTQKGTIVRQRVAAIALQSRTATGVRVQRLDEGNVIKSVAMLPADSEEDEEEGAVAGEAAADAAAGRGKTAVLVSLGQGEMVGALE